MVVERSVGLVPVGGEVLDMVVDVLVEVVVLVTTTDSTIKDISTPASSRLVVTSLAKLSSSKVSSMDVMSLEAMLLSMTMLSSTARLLSSNLRFDTSTPLIDLMLTWATTPVFSSAIWNASANASCLLSSKDSTVSPSNDTPATIITSGVDVLVVVVVVMVGKVGVEVQVEVEVEGEPVGGVLVLVGGPLGLVVEVDVVVVRSDSSVVGNVGGEVEAVEV